MTPAVVVFLGIVLTLFVLIIGGTVALSAWNTRAMRKRAAKLLEEERLRILGSPHLTLDDERAKRLTMFHPLPSSMITAEVGQWCYDFLSYVPETVSGRMPALVNEPRNIHYYLIFKTEDDALAFKFRWF